MPTVDKSNDRPFGQPKFKVDLKPTFAGYHYKFSMLLPLTGKIITPDPEPLKIVFEKEDFRKLQELFDDDFGGSTLFGNIRKPIIGRWKDSDKQIYINKHARFEVYTLRHDKAIEYFEILKENLETLKKELIIVVEQNEVTFIRAVPDVEKLRRENEVLRGKLRK